MSDGYSRYGEVGKPGEGYSHYTPDIPSDRTRQVAETHDTAPLHDTRYREEVVEKPKPKKKWSKK